MNKKGECIALVQPIDNWVPVTQVEDPNSPVLEERHCIIEYYCQQDIEGARSPFVVVSDIETGQLYVTYPTNVKIIR